tara:strand:- start:589 stop:1602 length:1014 start_codon:yes stop_codon:yes gene_type:complete
MVSDLKDKTKILIVGLGVVSILEAVYQKVLGNEVYIISSAYNFGGSWGPVYLKEHNIKTDLGVHYIEEQPDTEYMMNLILGKTIRLREKYTINFENLDNLVFEPNFKNNLYLVGGAIYLEKRLKDLIRNFKIRIINAKVEKVVRKNQFYDVFLKNNDEKQKIISCEKFIFTSGTKDINFFNENNLIKLPNNKSGVRIRSHMYFYIKNNNSNKFDQYICKNHSYIKYIHNISKDSQGNNKKFQFIVASLINNMEPTSFNKEKVRESLEELGFSNKNNIEHLHSIRTVLAEYGDNVNNVIKDNMGNNLEFIKTEDLGKSLGVYCKKYQNIFKKNNILLP